MVMIEDIVVQVGRLGLWIQALGLVVVIWLIIQGVTFYFNRKKRKMIEETRDRVKAVEEKLDSLVKKFDSSKKTK